VTLEIHRFRLSQLPLAARLVVSCFAVLTLIGYGVALLNMYLTYAGADGRPGLTPDDVTRRLYGDRSNTKLAAAITSGGMGQYLKSPAEKEQIFAWIHGGATRETFASVEPIFTRNCVRCHNPHGAASFRPLTSFEQVSAVAQVDRGESLATFARVAHTHLQSLALIYFGLGILFAFCGFGEKVKAVVVVTPFAALALDFGARGLASRWPEMVYPMMAAGGMAGAAMVAMVAGILWEVWLSRRSPGTEPAGAAPVPATVTG
jgi:hypothetical protein